MIQISLQGLGALYILLLFALCFVIVHGIKLAILGWRTFGKKLPAEKPKPAEKKTEPVYFIVEKKKKRAKAEYSEPKRIQFK